MAKKTHYLAFILSNWYMEVNLNGIFFYKRVFFVTDFADKLRRAMETEEHMCGILAELLRKNFCEELVEGGLEPVVNHLNAIQQDTERHSKILSEILSELPKGPSSE